MCQLEMLGRGCTLRGHCRHALRSDAAAHQIDQTSGCSAITALSGLELDWTSVEAIVEVFNQPTKEPDPDPAPMDSDGKIES